NKIHEVDEHSICFCPIRLFEGSVWTVEALELGQLIGHPARRHEDRNNHETSLALRLEDCRQFLGCDELRREEVGAYQEHGDRSSSKGQLDLLSPSAPWRELRV